MAKRSSVPSVAGLVLMAAGLAVVVACGTESSTFGDGSNAATNEDDSTSTPTGTFQPTTPPPDDSGTGNADDSGIDYAKCATDKQQGKLAPLDLVLMQDTSGSMFTYIDNTNTATKWTAIKAALSSFMADPASAGIGVGINFFPAFEGSVPNSCTTTAQCGAGRRCLLKYCAQTGTLCDVQADCQGSAAQNPCTDLRRCFANQEIICGYPGDCANFSLTPTTCNQPLQRGICSNEIVSCNVPDYSGLAVPIAALPGAAAAINNELAARIPNGMTPTHAALQGAIAAAKAQQAKRPEAVVAVVLSTDGIPYTNGRCVDAPAQINTVASAALNGSPSIKTFVIGVLSPRDNTAQATATLNGIANAGGTTTASIIGASATTQADFIAALQKIRAQSLPCELALPVPKVGTPDYNKVNVLYTDPATNVATTIQYVGAAAQCNATTGGWYYDVDPKTGGKPTKVILCPSTCQTVQKGLGTVDVVQGCETKTEPPPNVPK